MTPASPARNTTISASAAAVRHGCRRMQPSTRSARDGCTSNRLRTTLGHRPNQPGAKASISQSSALEPAASLLNQPQGLAADEDLRVVRIPPAERRHAAVLA